MYDLKTNFIIQRKEEHFFITFGVLFSCTQTMDSQENISSNDNNLSETKKAESEELIADPGLVVLLLPHFL